MTVAAIIQARMGSTRLPGKVLKSLAGETVLARVIGRVMSCSMLDLVVVATTESEQDEQVAAEAGRCGVKVYRGSEADVLDRFCQASSLANADTIVRVTADCPLYDGELLGKMLRAYFSGDARPDYLSNTLRRTYPRGLDTEIFSARALSVAWRSASEPYEREHVTPYIYSHPDRFSLVGYEGDEDHSEKRWTLDTPEDWQFISAVYQHLRESDNEAATMQDVLGLLDRHPELTAINAHVEQKPVNCS